MTVQDYFKHFDDTFGTSVSDNTDINNFPMLKMAFERLGEFMYNPSNDKKIITHRLGDIEKKIRSSISNEQRDMFDEYLEEENVSVTELARQMIVFGYSIAYQELKEMDALK